MAIEKPKNYALGSHEIKTFPKKQYEKVNEIIDAVNTLQSQVEDLEDNTGSTTMFALYSPKAVGQALSGAGAINVTSFYPAWTTGAGAASGTLADGTTIGQLKKIKLVVDGGGDGTLTPANLNDGTTITFNDAGDYVLLLWDGTKWFVIENFGCTIA